MKTVGFNDTQVHYEEVLVTGSGALNTTLKNAAAVWKSDDIIALEITADLFNANSDIYIEGTDRYDGLRHVDSAPSGYVYIKRRAMVAETFTTADTVKVAVAPGAPFEFIGFEIHLSSAPTTSEAFTLTVDADAGALFDTLLYTQDFSADSVVSKIWYPDKRLLYPNGKDIIRVAWTNTDTRNYGLKLKYRRLV